MFRKVPLIAAGALSLLWILPLTAEAARRGGRLGKDVESIIDLLKPEYLMGAIAFFSLVAIVTHVREGSILIRIGAVFLALVAVVLLAGTFVLGDFFGKSRGRRRSEAPPPAVRVVEAHAAFTMPARLPPLRS